jgi:hypothetical protein
MVRTQAASVLYQLPAISAQLLWLFCPCLAVCDGEYKGNIFSAVVVGTNIQTFIVAVHCGTVAQFSLHHKIHDIFDKVDDMKNLSFHRSIPHVRTGP